MASHSWICRISVSQMAYMSAFGKGVFVLADFQYLGNSKLGLFILRWHQSYLNSAYARIEPDSFLCLFEGPWQESSRETNPDSLKQENLCLSCCRRNYCSQTCQRTHLSVLMPQLPLDTSGKLCKDFDWGRFSFSVSYLALLFKGFL